MTPEVRRALVLAACWGLGLLGASAWLTPADDASAAALWDWAVAESGGDLAHPAFIDAAEAGNRLRPWQPGFERGRARVHQVDRARRLLVR